MNLQLSREELDLTNLISYEPWENNPHGDYWFYYIYCNNLDGSSFTIHYNFDKERRNQDLALLEQHAPDKKKSDPQPV